MPHLVLQTPSLQHLAGVKIVTCLWNQRDVLTQISQSYSQLPRRFSFHIKTVNWRGIEEEVKRKVPVLQLSQECNKQLLNLVRPLRKEIVEWCGYHGRSKFNNHLPQQFCWTMHGAINYKRTAELMVNDERLGVEKRYEIACLNCLEGKARQLFQRMGKKRKRKYVKRVEKIIFCERQHLIVFFTFTINDSAEYLRRYFETAMSERQSSLNKCLFQETLRRPTAIGNRWTCEYLFSKLNQEEKTQVFEEAKMGKYLSLHTFSLVSEEQQKILFRDCIRKLLIRLLDWPMHALFVEAIRCKWPLMNNDDRTEVLLAFTYKVYDGLQYFLLFWECWRLSPDHFKRQFINDANNLGEILETGEEEFIKFVLNEAPAYQLKRLVEGSGQLYDDLSDFLIDERVISEAALIECKETAALISSNDKEDEEKRLRSECLNLLVDKVIEERLGRREIGLEKRSGIEAENSLTHRKSPATKTKFNWTLVIEMAVRLARCCKRRNNTGN